MAKSAKKKPASRARSKPSTNTKTNTMTIPEISSNSLVAEEAPHSKPVEVTFTFIGGIGQATAVLFRKGILINMQSISNTGSIKFSEVQTSDVISVNGVCTGKAQVTVSTPTTPPSPKAFKAGLMMANFLIK